MQDWSNPAGWHEQQRIWRNSSAYGFQSRAAGASSVALGDSANASAAYSVALGQGSQATVANTVSVGTAGGERRIPMWLPARIQLMLLMSANSPVLGLGPELFLTTARERALWPRRQRQLRVCRRHQQQRLRIKQSGGWHKPD